MDTSLNWLERGAMDIETIAAAAAALIGSGTAQAAAESAGATALSSAQKLVNLVRRQFQGLPTYEATLELASASGTVENRSALAAALRSQAERDDSFRAELADVVLDLEKVLPAGLFSTVVGGEARIGKFVNIGRARDVTF